MAAATYHQVWWPPVDHRVYEPSNPPEWSTDAGGYVDPATGRLLPSWDDRLDLLDADPDAQPVHVVRFGVQVDAKGVLAGSKDADRCFGTITKCLTKQAADCHQLVTARQRAHMERLWQELRTPRAPSGTPTGCSMAQPKKARPGLRPGNRKNKVHKRETLGIGGRRVLISRQWSGKTLADHRADAVNGSRPCLGSPPTPPPPRPAGNNGTPGNWPAPVTRTSRLSAIRSCGRQAGHLTDDQVSEDVVALPRTPALLRTPKIRASPGRQGVSRASNANQ